MLVDKVEGMLLDLRKGVGRARMAELKDIVEAQKAGLNVEALRLMFAEKIVASAEVSAIAETGSEISANLSFADFGLGYTRKSRTQEGMAIRVDVVFSTENAPQIESADLPKMTEFFKAVGYGENSSAS